MAVYNLQINDRQLHYLRLALQQFVSNDPGEELDEFGFDIPTKLNDMLQDPLAEAPCLNGLTV